MEAFVIAIGSSFVMYSGSTWRDRVRGGVLFFAGIACGYIVFSH